MTSTIRVEDLRPIPTDEALALAQAEYDRFIALLEGLAPEAWEAGVEDCPAWTVKDTVAHVLGAAESMASMREMVHQIRRARAREGPIEDALSAVQVEERAGVPAFELVARLREKAQASVKARRRPPGFVRKIPVPGSAGERWTLGYLWDVIYVRDTWMHRVDISRATGAALELTAGHDGRLVTDVVREWATRLTQPFELTLTGPAGGTFVHGTAGERLTLDAVEFCRQVSGRGQPEGLLKTPVPF